jgi:hypothetical protein
MRPCVTTRRCNIHYVVVAASKHHRNGHEWHIAKPGRKLFWFQEHATYEGHSITPGRFASGNELQGTATRARVVPISFLLTLCKEILIRWVCERQTTRGSANSPCVRHSVAHVCGILLHFPCHRKSISAPNRPPERCFCTISYPKAQRACRQSVSTRSPYGCVRSVAPSRPLLCPSRPVSSDRPVSRTLFLLFCPVAVPCARWKSTTDCLAMSAPAADLPAGISRDDVRAPEQKHLCPILNPVHSPAQRASVLAADREIARGQKHPGVNPDNPNIRRYRLPWIADVRPHPGRHPTSLLLALTMRRHVRHVFPMSISSMHSFCSSCFGFSPSPSFSCSRSHLSNT